MTQFHDSSRISPLLALSKEFRLQRDFQAKLRNECERYLQKTHRILEPTPSLTSPLFPFPHIAAKMEHT